MAFSEEARRARVARGRAHWPSKERLEEILAEHGTVAASARAVGVPTSTLRHIVRKLGVSLQRHGNHMPPCTIRFGWSGEEHAALILGGELTRATGNEPFDLRWRGLRVEAKTAHPVLAGAGPDWVWQFHLARSRGRADAFFCIGCADNGLPRAYFLIPAAIAPRNKLSIPLSLRTKWIDYQVTPAIEPPAWTR